LEGDHGLRRVKKRRCALAALADWAFRRSASMFRIMKATEFPGRAAILCEATSFRIAE
jgi:hypothetical protein